MYFVQKKSIKSKVSIDGGCLLLMCPKFYASVTHKIIVLKISTETISRIMFYHNIEYSMKESMQDTNQ